LAVLGSQFVPDGELLIYMLSLDGKVLAVFGKSGKQAGQFGWIHEMAWTIRK
jgi:hypothetical protein